MTPRFIYAILIATTLFLLSGLSFAAEIKDPYLNGKPKDLEKNDSSSATARPKSAKMHKKVIKAKKANVKLTNINGASKAELKKLPNIGDAEADKIIAGRPYPTKANLKVNNIVSAQIYEAIKDRVVAKQPYIDAAKNAAIYTKKKKK